tara:strand:+ start:24673 stop:24855 length:183 start_codon:yes stop_codon:yes gene_type:complete
VKKGNYISAVIAAISFGFAVFIIDYYNNEVASIGKYIFQFVFFGVGLLVFDYVRLRNQKK